MDQYLSPRPALSVHYLQGARLENWRNFLRSGPVDLCQEKDKQQ